MLIVLKQRLSSKGKWLSNCPNREQFKYRRKTKTLHHLPIWHWSLIIVRGSALCWQIILKKRKIEGQQGLHLFLFDAASSWWYRDLEISLIKGIFPLTRTSPSKITFCCQQDSDLRDSAVGGRRSGWFLWSLLPAGWICSGNKTPGMWAPLYFLLFISESVTGPWLDQ